MVKIIIAKILENVQKRFAHVFYVSYAKITQHFQESRQMGNLLSLKTEFYDYNKPSYKSKNLVIPKMQGSA